jgi:large subunit ribosomal protein L29
MGFRSLSRVSLYGWQRINCLCERSFWFAIHSIQLLLKETNMKLKDIKALGANELRQREAELRKESFNLRIQKQVGQVENPVRARVIRRELARVLTVANQNSPAK